MWAHCTVPAQVSFYSFFPFFPFFFLLPTPVPTEVPQPPTPGLAEVASRVPFKNQFTPPPQKKKGFCSLQYPRRHMLTIHPNTAFGDLIRSSHETQSTTTASTNIDTISCPRLLRHDQGTGFKASVQFFIF